MSNLKGSSPSRERPGNSMSGFAALAIQLFWVITMIGALNTFGEQATDGAPWGILLPILGILAAVVSLNGYFTLQPNEARVLILFGSYKGTVRRSGFHWSNPFYTGGLIGQSATTKVSLRAHNFNSDTLKVNDKRGNPVEIAAVIVWRVTDTAQATFDVEDYRKYVEVQSESALRGIASRFAYDNAEHDEPTLRSGADEVAQALQDELQVRLGKAGVVVEEARLTHLAYAPEIASVMLRRQQAEAIVAARQQIVKGAVDMVRTALMELDRQHVVELDPERRAAMVSNLLVVLCGNADATPVINTGTLYT